MDTKYTFSNFPLDAIFRSMAPFIANLEQTFHITAVCGQIAGGRAMGSVSYTHLTLPTTERV